MSKCLWFCLLILACSPPAKKDTATNKTIQLPQLDCKSVHIWGEERKMLTEAYASEHYGKADYYLDSVAMVVIHFTVIPTLQETIEYFKSARLDPKRANIAQFSNLNVSVHYVVAPDGEIYCLLPENVLARHLIGFNHLSIGIENIAADASKLTQAQLEANATIVSYLSEKYSSLQYLIGHHEYDREDLPHYRLIKADNPAYQPYPKHDPGEKFMKQLRDMLTKEKNVELQP